MKKKIISCLAYLSLVIAFVIGCVVTDDGDVLKNLHLLSDNALTLGDAEHDVYKVYKDTDLYGYLSIGKSQGYGGPMKCVVLSDNMGKLIETEIVKEFETTAFLNKLFTKEYFKQYRDKSIGDKFAIKEDIQAVSGATVSSNAVAVAIREASHRIAEQALDMPVKKNIVGWDVPISEAILVLVFLSGTFAVLFSKKRLRYFTQFLAIIFIGFLFNASLTLTHFGRVLLAYFPDIHTHLSWWVLVCGTLLIILVFGKNVYCSSMCPFRATQVLLNKISGLNLKIPIKIRKIMSKTPMFLLWLSLIFIFLSANPTFVSYEPFAMLFSLKGYGIQWYILPCSLIGSLFLSNFFCRFFCPVGAAFSWLLKKRKKIVDIYYKKEYKSISEEDKQKYKAALSAQKINKEAVFAILLYVVCLVSILAFIIKSVNI